MAAFAGTAVKPVGIVERAAAQAEDVGEALEIQEELGAAAATEIQRDALVARVGAVVIGFRGTAREHDVLTAECPPSGPTGRIELIA